MAAANGRGELFIVDPQTGQELRCLEEVGLFPVIAFLPQRQELVVGNQRGELIFIDPSAAVIKEQFSIGCGAIQSIQCLPKNNSMIVVGDESGDVHLIDLSTGDYRLINRNQKSGSLVGSALLADGQIMRAYSSLGNTNAYVSITQKITDSFEDSLKARYYAWVCAVD